MKIKNDQRGIAHVALVILVVVVVGVIGLVGWKVWDNRSTKNTSPSSSNTTKTSATPSTLESSNNTETIKKVNNFEIKEFGVEFELPASLKGLYYFIDNNGRTAYFSLEELKNTDCAANKTSQIALTRYSEADYEEDVQAAASKNSAKKIGNYYFSTASGQAMCDSEGSTSQSKASNMKVEIVKILPSTLVQK